MQKSIWLLLVSVALFMVSPLPVNAQYSGITTEGDGIGIHYTDYGVIKNQANQVRPYSSSISAITIYQDVYLNGFDDVANLDDATLYYRDASQGFSSIEGDWKTISGTITAVSSSDNDRATFTLNVGTDISAGTQYLFYIKYTENGTDYYAYVDGSGVPTNDMPGTGPGAAENCFQILPNSSQTLQTIRIDGQTYDWNNPSNRIYSRSSAEANRTMDMTWDADYVYFLVDMNQDLGTDKINIAFDLDPGTTNGTTSAFGGAYYMDQYQPEVIFRVDGDNSNQNYKDEVSGGGWSNYAQITDPALMSNTLDGDLVEIRIARSEITSNQTELTDGFGVLVHFCNSSDELWDSFPLANPGIYSGSNQPMNVLTGFNGMQPGVTPETDLYFDGQYPQTPHTLFGTLAYRKLIITGTINAPDPGSMGSEAFINTEDLLVTDTLLIESGASFTLDDQVGNDLWVQKEFLNNGTFNANNRAVFFDGAGDHHLQGVSSIPFVQITSGGALILENNLTVGGSGTKFLSFSDGSSINLNGNNLESSGDGNIDLGSGAATITGTGTVTFNGNGAITNGGSLYTDENVTMAFSGGDLDFGSGITTVAGTVEILDNTGNITNNPTYTSTGKLRYNTGGTRTAGGEWPANPPFCPSDLSNVKLYNIEIAEGTTVSLNEDKNIYGSLTFGGLDLNGYTIDYACGCNGVYSTITYQNTGTYTPGVEWTVDACHVAVNSGTLEINSDLSANNLDIQPEGGVKILSGNTLTISDNLHIHADATGMGSLIDLGTLSYTPANTTVEQFLSLKNWHYVGTPMQADASITTQPYTNSNGKWNANVYTYNEACDIDPNPSSVSQDNFPEDVWEFAHNGGGYNDPATSWDQMEPGKGYIVYDESNKTIAFSGVDLNTGDFTLSTDFTFNDANGGYYDGWNLLANPYPSYYDAEQITFSGDVYTCVYIFTGSNYEYYLPSGGSTDGHDGVTLGSSINQYIPPMQGFMVKAHGAGASVNLPNSGRVHSSEPLYKASSAPNPSNALALRISSQNHSDAMVVRFMDAATSGFDGNLDAYKMAPFNPDIPQVYSHNNGLHYAINSLPWKRSSLPLGIKTDKSGEYSLSLDYTTLPDTTAVWLEDTRQHKFMQLTSNANYTFHANSGQNHGRFILHFGNSRTGIKQTEQHAAMRIWQSNGKLLWHIPNKNPGIVRIYSLDGRKLLQKRFTGVPIPLKIPPAYKKQMVIVHFISQYKDVYTQKMLLH